MPPDAARSRLNTIVMLIDADEDAEILDAARDVWTTLGPTLYRFHFTPRPRTFLGFLEGRLWYLGGLLGCGAFPGLAVTYGWPEGLGLLLAVAWPGLVAWAFFVSYRARAKIPGKELPRWSG